MALEASRSRRQVSWVRCLLAATGSPAMLLLVLGGLGAVLQPLLRSSWLSPDQLRCLVPIAVTVALPAGAVGGMVARLAFRGRRHRRGRRQLWRTRVSSAVMLGLLVGGVSTFLVLPVTLPLCRELVPSTPRNAFDSFLASAVVLALAGAANGSLGAAAVSLLHRPLPRREE